MKVAAIVLAAGSSRRLGHPKQDVRFGSETLLERTVRIATLAGLDPVYVVIEPGRFLCQIEATAILNPDASEGMASSIRTGVDAAAQNGVEGIVILACDQPAVTVGHLRALVQPGSEIIASSYASRKGVPAFFPASYFARLMELRGDTGARDLISSAPAVELLRGELDIDTAQDLARAYDLYPSGLPD